MADLRPRPPGRCGPRRYSHWTPVRAVQVVVDWYLGPTLATVAIIVGCVVAYFLLVVWLT
jgi:hypothetical protein